MDEQGRLRISQQQFKFIGRKSPVERNQYGAQPDTCELQFKNSGITFGNESDTVTALYAKVSSQNSCHGGDAMLKLTPGPSMTCIDILKR